MSLVPAVTEMIFAMGAGEIVVGVSTYDTYPEEVKTRPRVGALIDPDFERILALRPDLVVIYGSQADLIARLERVKIPIFNYVHSGLADITATIRAVGVRIGRGDAGRQLASRIEADLDSVRQRVAGKPRPRTAILFEREPGTLRDIYASAGIGFLHDMLTVAGGDDVFGDVKRQSMQATTEILLARGPDVIVELHPGAPWTADRLMREKQVWRGLPGVPAVRTDRVMMLVGDYLMVPGPRVAQATRAIAEAIHPAGRSAALTTGGAAVGEGAAGFSPPERGRLKPAAPYVPRPGRLKPAAPCAKISRFPDCQISR